MHVYIKGRYRKVDGQWHYGYSENVQYATARYANGGPDCAVEYIGPRPYPVNTVWTSEPTYWRQISDRELVRILLTSKNATHAARIMQAEAMAKANFVGPLRAGEVIALRRIMKDLGKSDDVVRGCIVIKDPTRSWRPGRLKGPYWLFRSPREDVSPQDFIKIARLYRGGNRGFRRAVIDALTSEDVIRDLTTLGTLDSLAALNVK